MAHSRILEVKLLSAEDLVEISKNMKTYAIVWIQQDQKLATGADQTGGTNPVWNDKFTFQVDDKFLNSEDAKIVVEIYAAAWVKDALIGSVNVNISDIFQLRSVTHAKINTSAARTATLQIHRPSGRPQGILNMEVALVDSTDPKPKTTDIINTEIHDEAKMISSQSDKTEFKTEDNSVKRPEKGSIVNGCFDSNESDEVKGNGSMVNGGSTVNGDSVCSTDVGPSASVVAAAIAKGLYKPPVNNQVQTKENSKIKEWTRKEREQEELEIKIERWGSEIPPAGAGSRKSGKGKKGRGKKGDRTKLFSCFSNAFGIEISITCGSNETKGIGTGNNNKVYHLSSVDDNYSQSIV